MYTTRGPVQRHAVHCRSEPYCCHHPTSSVPLLCGEEEEPLTSHGTGAEQASWGTWPHDSEGHSWSAWDLNPSRSDSSVLAGLHEALLGAQTEEGTVPPDICVVLSRLKASPHILFLCPLQRLSAPREQRVRPWFLHLQSLAWFVAHNMLEQTQAQWVIDFYVTAYHKPVPCQEDRDKAYKALSTARKMQVLIGIIGEQVLLTWSDQNTTPPKEKPTK